MLKPSQTLTRLEPTFLNRFSARAKERTLGRNYSPIFFEDLVMVLIKNHSLYVGVTFNS